MNPFIAVFKSSQITKKNYLTDAYLYVVKFLPNQLNFSYLSIQ